MKISIAMATYNGARFIREQLDSLAAQTLLPCELVVCDDGSSDATVEIVERFAAASPFPVRIHRNPQRLGYADNFLKAARLCEGEWIAFCDQDDWWQPDKLETVAAAIRRHPEVTLVTHPADLADEDLRPTGETAWPTPDRLHPRLSLIWRSGMGCGQVFRSFLVRDIPSERRFLMELSPRQTVPHDGWIAQLSQCIGSAYFLSRPLVLRRRHGGSVTSNRKPSTSSGFRWPGWHDISEVLLKRAELARDRAEVLAECALHVGQPISSTLRDASTYFAEAARILELRAECRRRSGLRSYGLALKLLGDPWYWRLGQGIVGWNGRIRDIFELFGIRATSLQTAKT